MSRQIIEYVEQLDDESKDLILRDRCACQALVRTLPPLAKQIALRLVYYSAEVSEDELEGWCSVRALLPAALDHLMKLRLVVRREATAKPGAVARPKILSAASAQRQRGERATFALNGNFADSMRAILAHGARPDWLFGAGPALLSPAAIESAANGAWHVVLSFLLSKAGGLPYRVPGYSMTRLSPALGTWLVRAGCFSETGRITERGFRFLFQNRRQQVWALLMEMLEEENLRGHRVAVLRFVFQLSSVSLGKCFVLDSFLSHANFPAREVLGYCRELGLVVFSGQHVYPAPIATDLTSEIDRALDSSEFGQGWIVVESNFRVYAYTNSPLQIQLLSLFVTIKQRLPNLVIGLIKRQRVRAAFANGIGAAEIVDFFHANAHCEMRKRKPIVPENVSDQIRLWEAEGSRLQFTQGYLYNGFMSQEERDVVVSRAEDAVIAAAANGDWVFVTASGYERIQAGNGQHARRPVPGPS